MRKIELSYSLTAPQDGQTPPSALLRNPMMDVLHAVLKNPLLEENHLLALLKRRDLTEELIKATASQTGERVDKVRSRAEASLRAARAQLQQAGQTVDREVHENAWTAVGVAAGVGLLLGIVIGRR